MEDQLLDVDKFTVTVVIKASMKPELKHDAQKLKMPRIIEQFDNKEAAKGRCKKVVRKWKEMNMRRFVTNSRRFNHGLMQTSLTSERK